MKVKKMLLILILPIFSCASQNTAAITELEEQLESQRVLSENEKKELETTIESLQKRIEDMESKDEDRLATINQQEDTITSLREMLEELEDKLSSAQFAAAAAEYDNTSTSHNEVSDIAIIDKGRIIRSFASLEGFIIEEKGSDTIQISSTVPEIPYVSLFIHSGSQGTSLYFTFISDQNKLPDEIMTVSAGTKSTLLFNPFSRKKNGYFEWFAPVDDDIKRFVEFILRKDDPILVLKTGEDTKETAISRDARSKLSEIIYTYKQLGGKW